MDAPEIAGQLAGGGTLAILDIIVFGTMLFLVSRAWLAAAPVFGRQAARAVLLYGLPALVLLCFSGHWIVGPWWGPRAEAFQLTALTLDIPLLLFWVICLAARAIRRALRRGPKMAERGEPRRWERVAFGAVTVALCLLAWCAQWYLYVDEAGVLARQTKQVGQTVTHLEVVANKPEEFAKEDRQLGAKIHIVQEILPESMDVHGFMEAYEAVPPLFGLAIERWSAKEAATVPLQRADITLRLTGPVPRLPELAAKTSRLARLVEWRLVDSAATAEATVVLSIYALPRGLGDVAVDSCGAPTSRVWLWPYTARLAGRRGELAGVCARLARLRPVREQVDAFMAARAYLDRVIKTIVKLRPVAEERARPSSPETNLGGM